MNKNTSSLKTVIIQNNCVVILIVLIIASALLSNVFLTWQNITNLLRQSIPLLCISMGMLSVILTGGIDLSVGAVMGLGNMMMAFLLDRYLGGSVGGMLLSALLTLCVGIAFGFIAGGLTAWGKMAPFIVTLAVMQIARGCAYLVTNGQPIRLDVKEAGIAPMAAFGNTMIPGINIPWPVLLGLIVVVIFYFVMKYTSFGRINIAIGSNEKAVQLSGLSVNRYKVMSYVICGFTSALAGVVITSRVSTGTPITGDGYELDAIAACVIGGASLSGGQGTVLHTIVGVYVLMLITNILNLLSVPSYPQQIIKGIVIIVAVLLQNRAMKSE